mgnify:CR=1 FL=1
MSNIIIDKEFISNALEAIANGVVITDATGKVIYLNETVRKDFGNSFEMTMQEWIEKYELLGGEYGNKHTFETLPIVKALMHRVVTTNEDFIVKDDNNIIKHLKISVSPIVDNDELKGTVMTYDDITEFKKQQVKLAHAVQDKELLFTVMESTSDIVAATDFHGNVKYINNAARKAFCLDKLKDLTQLHVKDYYTPESWKYITGKMIPRAMRKGAAEGEITFIKTNGDLMKVSQVLVCKKDKNGKVDFFASISRDISDIKEKEEEIIKQRAYLYSIIDANPNLIFVKDEAGKYKLVNKKFSKVASASIKNIIGKNDYEIGTPKDYADNYSKQDAEILRKGKSITFEELYVDEKSGKETWLQTVKTPLNSIDGQMEILGVSTDISEIKKIEKNLKKQLYFSELIANITADFFNISYKEIDEVMIYTLKTICNNTSMSRSVIVEIDSKGKFSYKHVYTTDINDPLNKSKYALKNYTDENFIWIQKEINKKGYAFCSEESTLDDNSAEKFLLKKLGIKSFFVIPLQLKNKRLGYLILSSRDKAQLPEADLTFIKTLTRTLANAIERANTEKYIQYRLKFEDIITEVSSKFINIKAEEIDNGIVEALEKIGNFFEADQGCIFHYNEQDQTLSLTHSWFSDGRAADACNCRDLPYDAFHWAFDTIRNNGFISVPNLDAIPEEGFLLKEIMSSGGVKSMFGVPIFFHNEFVGIYVFASFKKESFWMVEAEPLLKIMGQIFANALERKRNDEQLRESEKLYRTIVRNIPKTAIMVFDKDLKLKIIEGAIFKDHNLEPHFFEGKTVHDLGALKYGNYSVKDVDHYIEFFSNALKGEAGTMDRTVDNFHYKNYFIPARNTKNEVTAVLLISFDITDFKEIENKLQRQAFELQRSNEDLEQFAYAASHDLQEPLRMVSSYVHLIERKIGETLSDDVKEFMFFATDGVKRMQELINDILEYSRVERKGKPFDEIKLNNVIKAVKFNLQKAIADNNVELIHPEELPVIKADYSQITSLFQNLVDNAIKFRNNNKPIIEIGFSEQKHKYTFFVKDNGIGIEKKYYERIFVIFQRLNNRNEYPGTGIGLSICKKIVERHGGKIWVESEEGNGTTFFFELKK